MPPPLTNAIKTSRSRPVALRFLRLTVPPLIRLFVAPYLTRMIMKCSPVVQGRYPRLADRIFLASGLFGDSRFSMKDTCSMIIVDRCSYSNNHLSNEAFMFCTVSTKYVCGFDLHVKNLTTCVRDLPGKIFKKKTTPSLM